MLWTRGNSYQCCKNKYPREMEESYSRCTTGICLGPLLFTIFINGIFSFKKDKSLGNYVHNSTPYSYNKNLETVTCHLRQDFSIAAIWFYSCHMVLNPAKCYFILLGVSELSILTSFGIPLH